MTVAPLEFEAIAARRRGRPAFLELLRRHPTVAIGLAILALMLLMALLAPYLATVDPQALSPIRRLRFPSQANWFGTDMLGRDVYSRVVYGAQVSLWVGFWVAFFSTVIGLAIGLVTGFSRPVDAIVMRIMDGLMSIPPVPQVTRLVRGVVLSLREQPFVEAAIAVGTGFFKTLWRHILPNTVAPLLVQGTYICASAMITEAILSFIGAGTPPTIPSWGNIMAEGRALWQVKPYIVFFPAAFLSVPVLAVNLLGDGLRDALDPRMAKSL